MEHQVVASIVAFENVKEVTTDIYEGDICEVQALCPYVSEDTVDALDFTTYAVLDVV